MKSKFLKVSLCGIFAWVMLALASCSGDDGEKVVITNLSGQTWYNAQVWFRDTPGGDLNGFKDVGTVDVGKNCAVETDCQYFYIYAKSATGKMIMSKDIQISAKKATVKASNLY